MNSKDIESKIKRLRYDRVYSNSSLSKIKKESGMISVKLNRLEKNGLIIKIGKGKFIRNKSGIFSERHFYNNPSDKSSLRYEKIKPSKYQHFKRLFWSNRDNPIPLDNYIAKILIEDNYFNFSYLGLWFGESRVIEVYLNKIKSKEKIVLKSVERYYNI